MAKLHDLLAPHLLRRLKADVLRNIAPKRELRNRGTGSSSSPSLSPSTLSTRAGGAGHQPSRPLQTLIIYNSDWNPHNAIQVGVV